jgi:GNAT superfamily N-acetyltransferase
MSEPPRVALVPVAERDLDALFAMFGDYWVELDSADPLTPLPYGAPEYRRALLDDREGRELLWLLVDGDRAGFAFTRIDEDWPDDALVAEVSEFYVLPAHRRGGIGRAAVTALAERCRAAGATRLEADVLSGNAAALAFWRACGLASRRHSLFAHL